MKTAVCSLHPLKVRYPSEAAALEARDEFKQPTVRRNQLRAYECECGAWHLTKRRRT